MKCLFLLPLLAWCGHSTTVVGTLTTPTSDNPSGTCTFQAAEMFTSGVLQVTGSPTSVAFNSGALYVNLIPTDTATPLGQYYRVTCQAPGQMVNGHQISAYKWGPQTWLVPTSGSQIPMSDVVLTAPPNPSLSIMLAEILGITKNQCALFNGSSWTPFTCGSSASGLTWNSAVATWNGSTLTWQ